MTDARTNTDAETIKRAVRLLRTGQATQAEVATLAGRDRQLVRHWCKRAGIDAAAARAARLERLWTGRVR